MILLIYLCNSRRHDPHSAPDPVTLSPPSVVIEICITVGWRTVEASDGVPTESTLLVGE